MQDFVFTVKLCVKDEAVEEFKKAVDHNINALVNINGWPGVVYVWDANLYKLIKLIQTD